MNNVLIIEDDKEICVMIKDHLEKYNYQVFFTLTGANAIERIKELSPDLIILDLMLPFISGDELIRNIRKFSDVPVIVVSAKSLTFNKVELLRLGADDYLTKPFDLDELLARIERNLLRSQKDTPNLCLTFGELSINTSSKIVRFLYKGIIIKHNKTEPTYTKTSLFLCEKRRFLWPGLRKEGNLFKLAGPGGLAFFHLTKKEVSKWPMKK